MGDVEGHDDPAHALGNAIGAVEVGLREDGGELLAAVAGDEVGALVEDRGQGLGDALEAEVSGDVAVVVVEGLEEVDVHEHEPQGVARGAGVGPLLLDVLVEAPAVGDAGEAVQEGQGLELFVGIFQPSLDLLELEDLGVEFVLLSFEGQEDGHLALEGLLVQGLEQVVDGAGVVALENVVRLLVVGGDEDDGDVASAAVAAHELGGFETVHAGHLDIEKHESEVVLEHEAEGFHARGGRHDGELRDVLQHPFQGKEILGSVVHDKYAQGPWHGAQLTRRPAGGETGRSCSWARCSRPWLLVSQLWA